MATIQNVTCRRAFSVSALHRYPHFIHLFLHPFLHSVDMPGPKMCSTVKDLRTPFEEQPFFFFLNSWEEYPSWELGMCFLSFFIDRFNSLYFPCIKLCSGHIWSLGLAGWSGIPDRVAW